MHIKDKTSLKVLMVSTEYPPMAGGVGRYTFNLTRALKKIGLEVLVVSSDDGNGDFNGLSPNNRENSELLLKLVSKVNPDIVHIQFEPGLYGLKLDPVTPSNSKTYLDSFYYKCKIPIITTFHSACTFKEWMSLSMVIRKSGRTGKYGIPARIIVKKWNHLINYKSFMGLNREKLKHSHAGIMLSHYISNLLGGGNVIYHGAEPAIFPRPSKEKARSFFSLPQEKKIALAVGFKTTTKGWDILKEITLPENWIMVTNSSKGHYNGEDYNVKWKENNLGRNKNTIIDLEKGFLDDESLSMLFYAADVVLLPYRVTSASGVMFDTLAHGLPFIATDLKFFKEFSKQGLGITSKRKPREFSNAIKILENNYSSYMESVNTFKKNLLWEYVAKQHELIYYSAIENNIRKNFQEIEIK